MQSRGKGGGPLKQEVLQSGSMLRLHTDLSAHVIFTLLPGIHCMPCVPCVPCVHCMPYVLALCPMYALCRPTPHVHASPTCGSSVCLLCWGGRPRRLYMHAPYPPPCTGVAGLDASKEGFLCIGGRYGSSTPLRKALCWRTPPAPLGGIPGGSPGAPAADCTHMQLAQHASRSANIPYQE